MSKSKIINMCGVVAASKFKHLHYMSRFSKLSIEAVGRCVGKVYKVW